MGLTVAGPSFQHTCKAKAPMFKDFRTPWALRARFWLGDIHDLLRKVARFGVSGYRIILNDTV